MLISIDISENTNLPTLLVIKNKGYTIQVIYEEKDGKIDETKIVYEAILEDQEFSANNPEQLLGLIAMWEHRGDDWKYYPDTEPDIHRNLIDEAIIYDLHGNIVED